MGAWWAEEALIPVPPKEKFLIIIFLDAGANKLIDPCSLAMLFCFNDTVRKGRKNMECGCEVRWSQPKVTEGL